MQHDDMFPFAIPAITSLATSALQRWNRAADAQAQAAEASQTTDFQTLLNHAASGGKNSAGAIQQNVAALPEVQSLLASAGSGATVRLSVSRDGSLSQILPGGEKVTVPLSSQSHAVVRQWAAATPEASTAIALVA